eukprot:gb/GEZN01003775.1/.p1 GENE.gb/GEZN01003775.1/~~gb/GEZN01003775.1/.p1  ORF type:complete len:572 (-),score=72.20 gb/GEZN01003775.1/:120-1835(-)
MRKYRGVNPPPSWIDSSTGRDYQTFSDMSTALSKEKGSGQQMSPIKTGSKAKELGFDVYSDPSHGRGSWVTRRPDPSLFPLQSLGRKSGQQPIQRLGKENETGFCSEREKSMLELAHDGEPVDWPVVGAQSSDEDADLEDPASLSDDGFGATEVHAQDDLLDDAKKRVQWAEESCSDMACPPRERFRAAAQAISDINRSFQCLLENLMDFREAEQHNHPHRSTQQLNSLIQRLQEYEDLVVSKLAQLMCMFHYRSLSEICNRVCKDPDELVTKLENIAAHLQTAFGALRLDVAGIKKAQGKDDQMKVECLCLRILHGFPPMKEVLGLALGAACAGGIVVGTLVGIQTVLPHATLLPALGPIGAIAFGVCAGAFLLAIVSKWVVQVHASGKVPRDPSTEMVDEVLFYLRSTTLELKDKEKLIPFVESFDEGIRRYVEPTVPKTERSKQRERRQRRRRRQRKIIAVPTSKIYHSLKQSNQTGSLPSKHASQYVLPIAEHKKHTRAGLNSVPPSISQSPSGVTIPTVQEDIRVSFHGSPQSSRQSGDQTLDEPGECVLTSTVDTRTRPNKFVPV